jgi:predicted amidohydrolase
VVFPELSLTGYELALLQGVAFDKNSSNILRLSEAAIQYDITIITGAR